MDEQRREAPFPNDSNLHQQIHEEQQQRLRHQFRSFWENQRQEIKNVTDFKSHSLPLARIKKIMKADGDVRMISAEAPVLFARACEMFILELTLRAWNSTEENKRRTLQKNDIAAAITRTDIFDFLLDIVPREDLKDQALRTIPLAGPSNALTYSCMSAHDTPRARNPGVGNQALYPRQPQPYMGHPIWPQPSERQRSSSDP